MPSDIERGIDQEQEEDQFETEFGKIGKELSMEQREFSEEEYNQIRKAEKYYGSENQLDCPLLSRRSGMKNNLSVQHVIRQHQASKDSMWIGVYNKDNKEEEESDAGIKEAIIVRLLIEKRPDFRVTQKQLKAIKKKLSDLFLKNVLYYDKHEDTDVVIGKKILRNNVEEAIFEVTNLEGFGFNRTMEALTYSSLSKKKKQKEQDLL